MATPDSTLLEVIERLLAQQFAATERGVDAMRQTGRTAATAGAGLLAALGLLQQADIPLYMVAQVILAGGGVGLAVVMVWTSTGASVAGHRVELPIGPDPDVLLGLRDTGRLTEDDLMLSRLETARRTHGHNAERLGQLASALRRQTRLLAASVLAILGALAFILGGAIA